MLKNKKKITFGDAVSINTSSTFLAKSLCKHCKGSPSFYFYIKCYKYYKTVQDSNKIIESLKKIFKKMKYDYYLVDYPSNFNNLQSFSYKNFIKYKPRANMNKNINFYDGTMLIDCLTCKCRRTVWQFKQTTQTIESKAKSSPIFYPKKFIY